LLLSPSTPNSPEINQDILLPKIEKQKREKKLNKLKLKDVPINTKHEK